MSKARKQSAIAPATDLPAEPIVPAAAPPAPLAELPPFAILALTPDQIRLLSVWPRVPRDAHGAPDVRVWARMTAMPLRRVQELARGLFEMGAALPNGDLHVHVRGYLTSLAKARLL
jgi:predicted sugar kinase